MNHSVHMKGRMRFFLAAISLLCLSVSSMAQAKWSEVLWCEDNSTLYFIQRENNTTTPGKWGGWDVERLAVSNSVDNTGTSKPAWVDKVGKQVKRVVFDSSFANSAPFSTAYWFYNMNALEEINGLNYLNTYRTTTMRCMFHGCSKLKGVDLSKFDTSNVTDMFCMFFLTSALSSIDVSKFNTSQVTDMGSMFSNTGATSLDLSNFDTSNVTNMDGIFAGFKGTSLDVSNFNTSNVTNMSSMFSGCKKITTLDVSNLNTDKVTNMNYMFYMSSNLTTILCDDTWTAGTSTGMFEECYALKGAISYDESKLDATYANPTTGYFTTKTLPIEISNKRIPRDLADDLTKMNGVTVKDGGYAKYDDATKTLNLKDATIKGWSPLVSEVSDLTISIEGKNYFLTSSEESGHAIELKGTTTITGGGYLYADGGGNGAGIQATASLTIENAIVEVYGQYGIKGTRIKNLTTGRVSGSTLTLKGSRTKLIANSNNRWNDAGASIGNFRSINLQDDISFMKPSDAQVSDGTVKDSSGNTIIAKEVVISSPYKFYNITINGHEVTDWNCDDLTFINGVEVTHSTGYAKYNPNSNNLILNNVSINSSQSDFGIFSSSNNLTITVKNMVFIKSNTSAALYCISNTTITGGGMLIVQSNSTSGATAYTASVLTLDHVFMTISGGRDGLSGTIFINNDGTRTPRGGLLMQNYAVLRADGKERSIGGLTSFSLNDGIKIHSPEGAAWDSSTLDVRYDGSVCNEPIEICVDEEKLNLWVAGTQVTTLNGPYLNMVLGSDIYKPAQESKDYSIFYDPKSRTLHMDNVSINTPTNAALISQIPDLTISVENNPCGLATTNDNCNAITVYANTTIKAVDVETWIGSLGFDLIVSSSKLIGLEYWGINTGTITIDNTRLFATGGKYGISGRYYNDIYNTTLAAKGKDTYIWSTSNGGAIYNLNDLKLSDGLNIQMPENGTFTNHSVFADGELATTVFIYRKGGLKGDVNQDGKVDISDIVAVINTIAGDSTYKSTADVNEDGNIDISDIVAIINIIAGQ